MSNKKENKFCKKPNEIVQKIGNLPITATLTSSKNFPATCVAMDSVAKTEHRDDVARRAGNDDYSMSLEKLFNAFDTFIREYTKTTAGKINYNLSDSSELTIFLLWQIRHIRIHNGGLIDEKCKGVYESALSSALKNGIKPIIDLPENLEVGSEFTFQFDAYRSVKECVLKYIGKRVSKEDLKILSIRASVADVKFKGDVIITYEFGTLMIDLAEASECGCEIDTVKQEFVPAPGMVYNFKTGRMEIPSTGKSFPAKLVKR
ncbi:MAG: hypothetical protein O8C63_12135 [Candidatus Methanoperedens sp.]|nr:hypothetical protein [Candidatus Methanoperedens sp.]